MEAEDANQARINEMRQLLSQMGDFETAAEVGVIDPRRVARTPRAEGDIHARSGACRIWSRGFRR